MAKRRGISVKELNYKKKKLQFSHQDIESVAAKHKTPFFLYSEEILSKNYSSFYEAMSVDLLVLSFFKLS